MMYAIQNMELRSNHARSGSLRENKRRLCALDVVLVKNMFIHNQGEGTHRVVLSLVIYLQLYANL